MRGPFQFDKTACSGISYDIQLPSGIPICSIPPFLSPTFAPREPEVIGGAGAPMPPCNCITFDVSLDFGMPGGLGSLDFNIAAATQDCCDQEFDVGLALNIPCMPYFATGIGSINRGSIEVLLEKIEESGPGIRGCGLELGIVISIPESDGADLGNIAFAGRISGDNLVVNAGDVWVGVNPEVNVIARTWIPGDLGSFNWVYVSYDYAGTVGMIKNHNASKAVSDAGVHRRNLHLCVKDGTGKLSLQEIHWFNDIHLPGNWAGGY